MMNTSCRKGACAKVEERPKYVFAFEILEKHPYTVRADRTIHQGSDQSSWHKHDFVQVWYCYKGNYFHQVEDQVYECAVGSVVVVPLCSTHKFWMSEGADLMRLSICIDFLDNITAADYKNAIINLFLPDFFEELKLPVSYYKELSQESRTVWEQMFSWFAMLSYAPGDPVEENVIRQKMEQMFSVPEFAVVERIWEKAQRLLQTRVSPIFRIIAYLNKHYPQKITDEILLKEGNISRAVMYRYFKRIAKDTYATFLQYLRSRHAHIFLRETIYSLSDIAEFCGFYDVYHMSRVYSKCAGISISQQRIRIEQCRKVREGME